MNLDDLDGQLQANAVRLHRRLKLQRDEQRLVEELAETDGDLRRRHVAIDKAERRLAELDRPGIGYFFGTLFGDRQDRIDAQRQQVQRQQLERDERLAAKEPMQEELAKVGSELAELADVEQQREALLASKDQLLQSRNDAQGVKLFELGERLAELDSLHRELKEAVNAGKFVLAHLEASKVDLDGAGSWGIVDLSGDVFGSITGGLVSGLAKHANLREAQEHVQQAQLALHRFVRELRDVQDVHPDVIASLDGFGGLVKFADLFFDGLIVDWFVQSRIGSAKRQVEEADYKIRSIAHELWKRGEAVAAEREQLRAQRRDLLEQAR